MGQPKERSAKKNVFVEKYDEIRSFDGTDVTFYHKYVSQFFYEFCLLIKLSSIKKMIKVSSELQISY
jgi:hypothetical protein